MLQPSEEHDPDRPNPYGGRHQTLLEQKTELFSEYAGGL